MNDAKSPPEAPRPWGAFFISPPRNEIASPTPSQDENSQRFPCPPLLHFSPNSYIKSIFNAMLPAQQQNR